MQNLKKNNLCFDPLLFEKLIKRIFSRFYKVLKCTLFIFSISLFLFSPVCLFAQTGLDSPKKIKVVIDDNYPPYVFRDEEGNLQGISIDLWKLWEKKTGISVEVYGMDWAEALRRMEAGEFDVIDTIFFTEQRAKIYDYSKPYANIGVSIFFHKDISGIIDVDSLHGFVVAVKSGDAAIDYLKSKGITTLKEFPSYEAIIKAAKERKVSVAVIDDPPAHYFLYKVGIIDEFRHSKPLYTGKFHRAVRKGNMALLQILKEGFDRISKKEHEEINKKWFGIGHEYLSLRKYLRYIAIGFAAFIFIVLSMSIWNYILRKKVRERTVQLQEEIILKNKALDALKESEQKYRSIFENAVEGIFQTTPEGKIISVNPAWARLYGYTSPEEAIASIASIERIYTNPEDREQFKRTIEAKGKVSNYEILAKKKDGTSVWVNINARAVKDINGKIIFYEGTAEDITARKDYEYKIQQEREKFSFLVEKAPFGMALVDLKGHFLHINERWKELFGYDLSEIPNGRVWFMRAFPDVSRRKEAISAWIEDVNTLMPGDKKVRSFILTCKDGSEKIINFTLIAIQRDLFLVTCEDITMLKQIQNQLIQSQKMEAIGRLAGGIAHDFNNMLTVILGHTQLAQLTLNPSNPLYQRFLDIQKAAQRSAELTKNLLAFARKQTIIPKVLNINHQIEDMLKMLRRLIGENIELIWIPDTNLWDIKIDPSQFNQVIINIIINAKDAIEQSGTITIETKNVVMDENYCKTHLGFTSGEYVMVAISDNGVGMDKEVLEHIFEPFFTTKGIEKGSGLGLSTVYGIVKQNNGFINVYSEPKKGSTFKIYLPRYTGTKKDTTPTEQPRIVKSKGETILIVEDEKDVLELCTSMLYELGYNVITASSPSEAIKIAQSYKDDIHLVLTDIVMPEMNGKELADTLKASRPFIKCLFMSGYTENAIVKNGVLKEGVNYIQKPFSLNELSLKLREAIEG